MERHVMHYETLLRVTDAISQSKDPEEVVLLTVESVKTALNVKGCSIFLINKKTFIKIGMFDTRNKMGEDINLYKRLLNKGYKAKVIQTITETHLGEPESFLRLLKRQKKYGRFSYLERTPDYSLKNIILSLIMTSPIGILYSLRIYYYMFKKRLKETKDFVFLIVFLIIF